MIIEAPGDWVQCGRTFSKNEIEKICETVGWLPKFPGEARGTGLARPVKQYQGSPRRVWVKPLQQEFRYLLCYKSLSGRVVS